MAQSPKSGLPESPRRRAALRRMAGAVVAAYVVPEVMFLSAARAGNSAPSVPSSPSIPAPSSGTSIVTPDPITPAPSSPAVEDGPSRAEEVARETCTLPETRGQNSISISRTDLARSQDAVDAGYAKPLDQIWNEFISSYDGKVLGVEFLDRQRNPRYRFRAISRSGRLETVTISAQTGAIQRIVGC